MLTLRFEHLLARLFQCIFLLISTLVSSLLFKLMSDDWMTYLINICYTHFSRMYEHKRKKICFHYSHAREGGNTTFFLCAFSPHYHGRRIFFPSKFTRFYRCNEFHLLFVTLPFICIGGFIIYVFNFLRLLQWKQSNENSKVPL